MPVKECASYILRSLVLMTVAWVLASATTPTVQTFAGGYLGDGKPATSASFAYPISVARDTKGNLYVSDSYHCRIRKINPAGIISTIAGTGICGYSGDGGPALSATMSSPAGIAFDSKGNLLLADQGNNRIRKISSAGIITTIAGNGTSGYSGDGGPAVQASLNGPLAIAVDQTGNLYIGDSGNFLIRLVDTAGNIRTVAGNHTLGFSGDGGPATSAQIAYVYAVQSDHNGNFYIADLGNSRVRKVDSAGTITTYAGNGSNGNSGSGGLATSAAIGNPGGLLLTEGNLYISTAGNIWAVNQSTQIIKIIAGNAGGSTGFSGDGNSATAASFLSPWGMVSDGAGGIFVTDSGNNRLRHIAGSTQTVSTTAGGFIGDGGKANAASLNFNQLEHAAFDTAGNLYIADGRNNRIRRVSSSGVITTFAGTGITGYSGDGGLATAATLSNPTAVVADRNGNIFIADTGNGVIRKVDSSGTITTFSSVTIYWQGALAIDASGNLYASDGLYEIWKILPSGSATVVAGVLYEIGYNGDEIPATQASLGEPTGIAIDSMGNLYIADWLNNRIRKVDTNGIISTVAGDGTPGFSGDGGPATSAMLSLPMDVAVDNQGDFYVADWLNFRVRLVNRSGTIETFAGSGRFGYNGDGLPAKQANLFPSGLVVRNGAVYVIDQASYRVRKIH